MQHSVNLFSLYTASRMSIEDYCRYECVLSGRDYPTNLGDREKDSLFSLVSLFQEKGITYDEMKYFYYSYSIPHIGKEFDLLKFTKEDVLNIELKSENVGEERIYNQLLCNYKYLKYLNKNMFLFTFVSSTSELYKLSAHLKLTKVNVSELIDMLQKVNVPYDVEIEKMFKTSDYLVSPLSTPRKFLKEQYFLTTQQDYIKKMLLRDLEKNSIFKLVGEAGTGKTLMVFDLARELSLHHCTAIITCGKLICSHFIIANNIPDLDIYSIHEFEDTKHYEYILVDESQKLSPNHFYQLIRYVKENNSKIVFALDPKQALTLSEVKSNINGLIDKEKPIRYKLSNRIRINNDIYLFLNYLFDLSNGLSIWSKNIKLYVANNIDELNKYATICKKDDFTYIPLTNRYKFSDLKETPIEDTFGQDYENVMIIMDGLFYYEDNKLKASNVKNQKYLPLQVLYQAISRVRDNLVIIVYKNKNIVKKILKNAHF